MEYLSELTEIQFAMIVVGAVLVTAFILALISKKKRN
jgi:hypothetical protein